MDNVLDFKLDPPRGQPLRTAVVLISQVESGSDFVIEALEHIDPPSLPQAVKTMQQLIKLTSLIETDGPDSAKRSVREFASPPSSVKKCRSLEQLPSDASL